MEGVLLSFAALFVSFVCTPTHHLDVAPTTPSWQNQTLNSDEYAVGYLYLILTQGSFSLTELSDNNPLDIGSFLGNMGGFWGK